MIFDLRANAFASELSALYQTAAQHGWCDEDTTAKSIPLKEFVRALGVAILLSKEHPKLDWPVPGIHPSGTIWLSYVQGESKGLSLELRDDGYRWTQNSMGDKRTFHSDSLNDVCEAMRTVFL